MLKKGQKNIRKLGDIENELKCANNLVSEVRIKKRLIYILIMVEERTRTKQRKTM